MLPCRGAVKEWVGTHDWSKARMGLALGVFAMRGATGGACQAELNSKKLSHLLTERGGVRGFLMTAAPPAFKRAACLT